MLSPVRNLNGITEEGDMERAEARVKGEGSEWEGKAAASRTHSKRWRAVMHGPDVIPLAFIEAARQDGRVQITAFPQLSRPETLCSILIQPP
jgi:hypothetical protein